MSIKKTLLMLGAALAVCCCGGAQAQSFHVLYHFKGSDGFQPSAPLAFDGAGAIYGSTRSGGADGIGDREGSPNGVTFGPDGALYGAAFSYDDQSRGGILFRLDP